MPAVSRATALITNDQIAESGFHLESKEIATFGNEWSSFPFYLNDKIANFSEDEVDKLSEFLHQHPDGLIVVGSELNPAELAEEMGLNTSLIKVQHRGRAAFLRQKQLRVASLPRVSK